MLLNEIKITQVVMIRLASLRETAVDACKVVLIRAIAK
jgi:hypothetical protein